MQSHKEAILMYFDLRDNIEDWEKFGFDPVAFKEEVLAKFIKSWEYDW